MQDYSKTEKFNNKPTLVKFRTGVAGFNYTYQIGQEVELPMRQARKWVVSGVAEFVQDAPKPKKETATLKPKKERAARKPKVETPEVVIDKETATKEESDN